MKFLLAIFFCLFSTIVFAQNREAKKIAEFGREPCGYFMALMDAAFLEMQNSPDSKIHVVYYGRRYIREVVQDKKTKTDIIKLKYPHREDGLNYAKSIPQYLTSELRYEKAANLMKDRIILINGGFRENLAVEIWLVPKDAEPPKPTPTIDEKDIIFSNRNPLKTPDYTDCYGGYE